MSREGDKVKIGNAHNPRVEYYEIKIVVSNEEEAEKVIDTLEKSEITNKDKSRGI